MELVVALVRCLSVLALGVFAGAMLTEGGFLVPLWRSLPPAEFLAWYRANDRRLVAFFGPLTTATVLLALAAAAGALAQHHPGRWWSAAAAALALVVLATFFVYFRAANASFAAGSVATGDVGRALARWARWHWWRTGLSLAAFAAGILALMECA